VRKNPTGDFTDSVWVGAGRAPPNDLEIHKRIGSTQRYNDDT
jgi:hypothetical protein